MQIQLKFIVTIFALVFLLVSGCVKLEMKDVVSDTLDSSKELYETVQRRRNGEELRKYTHALPSPNENVDVKNISTCKEQIQQIIERSGVTITEIESESSEITVINDVRSVRCTIAVAVKK